MYVFTKYFQKFVYKDSNYCVVVVIMYILHKYNKNFKLHYKVPFIPIQILEYELKVNDRWKYTKIKKKKKNKTLST